MTRPPLGSSLDIPEVHALHDEIERYRRQELEWDEFQRMAESELARLRGLVEEAQEALRPHEEGTSPTAKLLDACVKRCRRQTAALETVRRELDLPEHIAEIVGAALGSQEPGL